MSFDIKGKAMASSWFHECVLRQALDAAVDLPFALPTAVAGLALATVYSSQGWLGRWFVKAGINLIFTRAAVFLAMVFVSFPFVVRSLQPVMADQVRSLPSPSLIPFTVRSVFSGGKGPFPVTFVCLLLCRIMFFSLFLFFNLFFVGVSFLDSPVISILPLQRASPACDLNVTWAG